MISPEDITFLKESVGMCLLFVFQYVLKRKKKLFWYDNFFGKFFSSQDTPSCTRKYFENH